MTFKEIFENKGLYVAESFREGVCFRVNEYGELHTLTYDKNDLFPEVHPTKMYKGLLNKDYKEIFTKFQLFGDKRKKLFK